MCASFTPPNSCLILLTAVCINTAPRGWTATQILTPVAVGLSLCLAFAFWLLYQRGRLSRLTSIFPSMRRARQGLTPRGWSYGNDTPGSGALPQIPDAEATPMIDRHHHWLSLSPHDDAAARQRLSVRMRMTPAFSKAIRSIGRLFGWGPIPVSHIPVPKTFDIEDPVTETDAFDSLRSDASRSWRNGLPIVGQNSGSMVDRITSETSLSSVALDSVLDNGPGNYEDTGNVFEDRGANDYDDGTNAQGGVMLISRNGEDFSLLTRSTTSLPIGNNSVEVDRRSIEVVPPTPTTSRRGNKSRHDPRGTRDHLTSQPLHKHPSFARSASTPPLYPSSPKRSQTHPLSSSTDDLSDLCLHPQIGRAHV